MAKKEKVEALVPGNWQLIPLGNAVIRIKRGKTPKYVEISDVPVFAQKCNQKDGSINLEKAQFLDPDILSKFDNDEFLADCDIVINSTGTGTLGRVGYYRSEYANPYKKVLPDSHITVVRLGNLIIPKYAYHYLVSKQAYLEAQGVGSTNQKELKPDIIGGMIIPVPPLSEQQRIVDRIESLFAKLDEAKEKAQAVVDGFEDRKAAILHKAFTGELTEKWRNEKDISLDQWQYIEWGSFLESIEAGKNWNALGRPPENDEFGVVKVSAVTWGEFDEEESKTCTDQSQWNEKKQIRTGDFLFSRANTIQLVGNCVIVKEVSKRLMLSDKILRFNMSSLVDPEYILFFTRSDFYRSQVEELASGNQDGMRNVSQANLKKIVFPIPSKEEQLQIVKVLSSYLNKINIAKQAAQEVIDNIDSMKKSILAKAFRGKLGTNDPTEPPVELSC